MLKQVYDYMNGFAKRSLMEQSIEKQQEVVKLILDGLPQALRQQMHAKQLESSSPAKGAREARSENDKKLDAYNVAKNELTSLEDKYKTHLLTDHKISAKDIDCKFGRIGTNTVHL